MKKLWFLMPIILLVSCFKKPLPKQIPKTGENKIVWKMKLDTLNDNIVPPIHYFHPDISKHPLAALSDGGYLTALESSSGQEVIIRKINSSRAIQWQKGFSAAHFTEIAAIAQASDGNYILVGETYNKDGEFSTNHGQSDLWILKLDQNGNKLWQKLLGGSDVEDAYSLVMNQDGSFVIAAKTGSNDGDVIGAPGGDLATWIVKLNADGQIMWQKAYANQTYTVITLLVGSGDGGYILGGQVATTKENIYRDQFLIKIDENGNKAWVKNYDQDFERINSVVIASDGDLVVTGITDCILRLNRNGETKWRKVIGNKRLVEGSNSIISVPGGFVLAGYNNSYGDDLKPDMSVLKIDDDGNPLWQDVLGGNDYDEALSIVNASDGGYVVLGASLSKEGTFGTPGIYLFKIRE